MKRIILILIILAGMVAFWVGITAAATLYENYDIGDNSGAIMAGDKWSAQMFAVGASGHTVSRVDVKVWRSGTPGTMTVSIRHMVNSGGSWIIAGGDLCAGTINATAFGDSPGAWNTINMTPETSLSASNRYAVVVRAVAGDDSNYAVWRYNSSDGYNGGYYDSFDGGVSWTRNASFDFMFKIYGSDVLSITNAEVYSSLREDGDWLVVFLYKNIYPPYYEYEDPIQYFNLQFRDTNVSNLIAQSKMPAWGYKPGAIYLSKSSTTNLTWWDNYTIRMEGNPAKFSAPYPSTSYTLQPIDYIGSETFWLGEWIISSAHVIESYYGVNLTMDSIGNETLPYTILNELGCEIYMAGIPGIEDLCPERFYITTWSPGEEEPGYNTTYQDTLNWINRTSTNGSSGQIPMALNETGNLFGVEGKTIGLGIGFIVWLVVAGFTTRGTKDIPVGMGIAAIVFGVIAWIGLISLQPVLLAAGFAVLFVLWIIFLRGT